MVRKVRRSVLVVVIAALLASCASSDQPAGGTVAPAGAQTSTYFVSEAKGRVQRKAYKPAINDPVSSRAEPTLDWSAQHERNPQTNPSQSVRLSGHRVSMANLEETLPGFELRDRTVLMNESRAGSGPDGPRVVLVAVSADYTIMTLSYELGLEELVEWSNALRPVEEAGWVARGGVIAP